MEGMSQEMGYIIKMRFFFFLRRLNLLFFYTFSTAKPCVVLHVFNVLLLVCLSTEMLVL